MAISINVINFVMAKKSHKRTGSKKPIAMTIEKYLKPSAAQLLIVVASFTIVGIALLNVSRAATNIKPQLGGVLDRQNAPSTAYENVVNAYIVDTTWASVQPTQGGPIAANNDIDKAISYARSRTGANIHLKLRVRAGGDAPGWAKNLPVTSGQQGPFNICDDHGQTTHCGSVGHFWESNFKQAYAELQTKLAAKYDGVAEVQEVDIVGCTTIFEEPFLRQGNLAANVTAYKNAGYTEAANQQCIKDAMVAHQVWTQTRSSESFNPYSSWNGSGFSVNEDFTEQMVNYCRQVLGERCVLGNDSIGKSNISYACADIGAAGWASKDDYGRMYTAIKCKGKPIYFQTATMAKIGTAGLQDALTWAASLGAGMVELPQGYEAISVANMSNYDKALENNALGGSPGGPTPPSISFSASPTTITQGASSALTWNVSGTTPTCTASGGWTGSKSASGSQTVSPTTTTTYNLACTNTAGSDNKSVTVTVSNVTPPTVTLNAAPSSITSGGSSTLTWSTTGTSPTCTASGNWTGSKSASGTQTVSPTSNATYTLSCTNSAGTDSATTTVAVTPNVVAPVVSLNASPTSISSGNSSTLSWSVTGTAPNCTASGGWSGNKNSSGSTSVGPLTTTTYTLACSNSAGSDSKTVTVTVTQAVIAREDVNQDGRVDIQDISAVIGKYGQTGGSIGRSDVNGDGKVGIEDISLVISKYGT